MFIDQESFGREDRFSERGPVLRLKRRHPGSFSPIRLVEGYLPIEEHGLIGDGTTVALVGRDEL
jgi:hypothetical protein